MGIHLNKPYKIIALKHKLYEAHYHIPSAGVVVIPRRQLGDEVMCDLRWEIGIDRMGTIHNAMFAVANLEPLEPLADDQLFEIWIHTLKS